MQINILVGTVHGNALNVAQALQLCAEELSVQLSIMPMDTLSVDVMQQPGVFLICTSTTGSGHVPDNAASFYHALDAQAQYLGHVRYGVIALGDSSYGDTYCGGGKRFDERLNDLGAQRLGSMLCIDACETAEPEMVALPWFQDWVAAIPSLSS